MEYTKGKWHIAEYGTYDDGKPKHYAIIVGGVTIANLGTSTNINAVEIEANAHLIAAAVNACIKVNPDNPMAVAESISAMYEALKAIIDAEKDGFERLGYGRSQDAQKALAEAEGK